MGGSDGLHLCGLRLTGFLPALSVGVCAEADDYRVDGDEDREDAGEAALHGDEDDAGDGLGGLRDAELLDEDQDAADREDADDLDDDVDPVAGLLLVRSRPQEEDEHEGFDD